jgi:Bacterial aa3 type cytochrome c oxidase subunit IV
LRYGHAADRGEREIEMANHGEVEYATATGNDYPAHEATYQNFVRLVKGSVAVIVVILILMAIFLT